jgi:hypothetical protein
MASQLNSTIHTKNNYYTHFLHASQKLDLRGIFLNTFYMASITFILKPPKILQVRKLETSIFDEYLCKNPH